MAKLRRLIAKEVCKILEQNGFVRMRQKGSHIHFKKTTPTETFKATVPDHGKKPLRIGTLHQIIRQLGLPRQLFE